MNINVKTITGKNIPYEINFNDNIESLKRKIQDKEGINMNEQRLIYCGKQLEDNQTFNNYNIQSDSIIHLLLKLRG